jgi:outer membrane protein OmpA-like peptidoglycan-associated protein
VGQVSDLPVVRCLGMVLLASMAMAQQRNFVSCPIVRDTKTVPCYLAEYDGELYYLGMQQDVASEFHAPQLKHEVLVEGRVAEGPRVCGGIPLQPVSISVLKEVNLTCNTLLPPEPGMDAPPASPHPAARRSDAGEFTVLYAFNDDDLDYAGNLVVTEAAAYAKRIGATKVKAAGYRATTILSNGGHLIEQAGIAEKRAQNIATLLRGLGVSGVTPEWKVEPEPGDGVTDPSRRHVTILVTR